VGGTTAGYLPCDRGATWPEQRSGILFALLAQRGGVEADPPGRHRAAAARVGEIQVRRLERRRGACRRAGRPETGAGDGQQVVFSLPCATPAGGQRGANVWRRCLGQRPVAGQVEREPEDVRAAVKLGEVHTRS
jgi:hypothetical protein